MMVLQIHTNVTTPFGSSITIQIHIVVPFYVCSGTACLILPLILRFKFINEWNGIELNLLNFQNMVVHVFTRDEEVLAGKVMYTL